MRFKFFVLYTAFFLLPGISMADVKNIYGLNEHVYIPEIDMHMSAKLDTGAKLHLSARDIEHFKRDGKSGCAFFGTRRSSRACPELL